MFNILKTRRGKLKNNLESLLKNEDLINKVLVLVDIYEKDNLETIEKLKKDKKVTLNKINGGLKQTIQAHGPITLVLIGSASKRIYGALLEKVKEKENIIERIIKWIRK